MSKAESFVIVPGADDVLSPDEETNSTNDIPPYPEEIADGPSSVPAGPAPAPRPRGRPRGSKLTPRASVDEILEGKHEDKPDTNQAPEPKAAEQIPAFGSDSSGLRENLAKMREILEAFTQASLALLVQQETKISRMETESAEALRGVEAKLKAVRELLQ